MDEAGDEKINGAVEDTGFFYVDNLQFPQYTPHQERLTSEGEVYFRPTSIPGLLNTTLVVILYVAVTEAYKIIMQSHEMQALTSVWMRRAFMLERNQKLHYLA